MEEDESDIAGDDIRDGVEEPEEEGEGRGSAGRVVRTSAAVAASVRSWRRERINCCGRRMGTVSEQNSAS